MPSCRQRLTEIGLTSDGTFWRWSANRRISFRPWPLRLTALLPEPPIFPAVSTRFIKPGRSPLHPIVALRTDKGPLAFVPRCGVKPPQTPSAFIPRRMVEPPPQPAEPGLTRGKSAPQAPRISRPVPQKYGPKHSEQLPRLKMAIFADHCHRVFARAEELLLVFPFDDVHCTYRAAAPPNTIADFPEKMAISGNTGRTLQHPYTSVNRPHSALDPNPVLDLDSDLNLISRSDSENPIPSNESPPHISHSVVNPTKVVLSAGSQRCERRGTRHLQYATT